MTITVDTTYQVAAGQRVQVREETAFEVQGRLVNNGVIAAAMGMNDYSALRGSGVFENHGVLAVQSRSTASAVMFHGGEVDNDGTILARGSGVGEGVGMYDAGAVSNSGLIKATGGWSTGVHLFDSDGADQGLSFTNSGAVRAKFAVLADSLATNTASPFAHILNTGRLVGDIYAPSLRAEVVNRGVIVGGATLSGWNDSFDSRHGLVTLSSGQAVIGAGDGADTIYGGKAGEQILGDHQGGETAGDGADRLSGGGGDDEIHGGGGGDTLEGGRGLDALFGGSGADTFLVTGQDALAAGGGFDLIGDLETADRIVLTAIDANARKAGHQAFQLVATFDGHAGEVAVHYNEGADLTFIDLDTDGDLQADARIVARGDHHDFTNFVL